MIRAKEYEPLEQYITHGIIPTHGTQTAAKKAAASIGWQQHHIERVERSFEEVYQITQNPP